MNPTMNTVNQTFDWHRFTAALRKEYVENRTIILLAIVGMYLLLTIGMIFNNVTESLDNGLVNSIRNYVPQKTGYIMLVLTCIIFPSLAFRNLKSKSGRVSLLTSPSSTLEKFLVNITIYVIGFFVIFHICAQLADFTRIAVLLPFRSDKLIVPGSINFLNLVNDTVTGVGTSQVTAVTTTLSVNLLSCMAMYLMGSILWPRLSLLKTFGAGQVLSAIVLVLVFIAILIHFGNEQISDKLAEFVFARGKGIQWIWAGWYIAETLIFGALAWYLFKHKDVISTKWWK